MQNETILSDTYELSEKIKSHRHKIFILCLITLIFTIFASQLIIYKLCTFMLAHPKEYDGIAPYWVVFAIASAIYTYILSKVIEPLLNFLTSLVPVITFQPKFKQKILAGAGKIEDISTYKKYRTVSLLKSFEHYNIPIEELRLIKDNLNYDVFSPVLILAPSTPLVGSEEGHTFLNHITIEVQSFIYYLLPLPALFYFYLTHPVVFN